VTNPVPGHRVTTPYGKKGSWAAGYHTGDDYAAPAGTPVVAAASGSVVRNGRDQAYGWYVEIQTGQVRHRYCHLREPSSAKYGQEVAAGQRIGSVGSTGNSTGPHLHYEERLPPYGYNQHRRPQYNQQDQEEDDMAAEDVWKYPVEDDFGGQFSAETYLRRVPRIADEVISRRLTLPDGTEADLWTVLVDTLTRVKRIEEQLDPHRAERGTP